MKNKVLIITSIIFILSIVIVVVVNNINKFNSEIVNEFYNQYKQDVDDGVKAFMESQLFNKMNESTQVKEMNNLLKMYQNNGIIKGLYYDENNKLFSFTYNSGEIKGALGGVSLKEWDSIMN